jgi:hypothetical protein
MGLGLVIVQIAWLPVEPRILHVWTASNKFRDEQIKALVNDVIKLANTCLNVVDKKNVRPVHNSEMANHCIDISPFESKPADAFTHGSVPQIFYIASQSTRLMVSVDSQDRNANLSNV